MIIADHFGADHRVVLQWFHEWFRLGPLPGNRHIKWSDAAIGDLCVYRD